MVESDPAITAELLALVNSPMFAVKEKVTTAAHAVSMLGLEHTKSVVVTLAMRTMVSTGPRTPAVRRCWTHSIACATLASEFAQPFGLAGTWYTSPACYTT
jgi:HD-like signal output (HDOD) protein